MIVVAKGTGALVTAIPSLIALVHPAAFVVTTVYTPVAVAVYA